MVTPNTNLTDRGIIVVDDETFSLSIVTQLARSIGFTNVKSEKSVASALLALKAFVGKQAPFIVVDFQMPEHNGLQLLKAVRVGLIHKDRALPVIMLTGHSDAELVGQALKLDVNAFLSKPLSKAALEKRLLHILDNPTEPRPAEYYQNIPTRVSSIQAPPKFNEDKEDQGKKLTLGDLKVGDKLAAPIRLKANAQVLVECGEHITAQQIQRLENVVEIGSELDDIFIM